MKVLSNCLVLILILVFAGCANMSKRAKCIARGTLAGAAVGAGVGAAVGNQGDNDSGEGAAVGVAAGALVGGALGLVICKEELDSDGDGVLDDLDKCPNTPMGVEVDADGCPMDSDGDGVPDYLDKCPNTPRGCKVDKRGCPIDSDRDGVPNCLDRCPDTPRGEKVDGYGCPAVGGHLLILEGIQFAFDSASISKDSEPILNTAVADLKKNKRVKVRIEGYTDSSGPEEYNLGLSQKRAEAVKNYLVANGIEESRMTVKGFGEADPIASNDTREGRMKNRRVEFVITKK